MKRRLFVIVLSAILVVGLWHSGVLRYGQVPGLNAKQQVLQNYLDNLPKRRKLIGTNIDQLQAELGAPTHRREGVLMYELTALGSANPLVFLERQTITLYVEFDSEGRITSAQSLD